MFETTNQITGFECEIMSFQNTTGWKYSLNGGFSGKCDSFLQKLYNLKSPISKIECVFGFSGIITRF